MDYLLPVEPSCPPPDIPLDITPDITVDLQVVDTPLDPDCPDPSLAGVWTRARWGDTWEPGYALWQAGEPAARMGLQLQHRFMTPHSGASYTYTVGGDRIAVRLWATPAEMAAAQANTLPLLFNRVFADYFTQSGDLCLHGGAVVHARQAWVVVGAAGAGKSTLLAALTALGAPLLTDDLVVLLPRGLPVGAAITVPPGYARLRVYADSATAVDVDPQHLEVTLDFDPKRYLDPPQAQQAAPLGGILVLQPRSTMFDRVRLRPQAALAALLEHCSGRPLPVPDQQTWRFAQLSQLVRRIPAWQVTLPDDLGALRAGAAHLLDTLATPIPA